MCERDPIQCIVPPYVTDSLAQSDDPAVRARAITTIRQSARFRAMRIAAQALPTLMVTIAPDKKKHRLVYDAQQKDQLPGKLARSEGDAKVADVAVNEAYDHSGQTYDFYNKIFSRNSLDGEGMILISSVHVAEPDFSSGKFIPMNNAFWDGEQMAYGDGDEVIFTRFTKSLDVVGHELTHGVQSFTSNLTYSRQSGALNEHFADVFGVLVRQWKNGESVDSANWLVGAEIMVPAETRMAIRNMEKPGTAFANDPFIGTDPQPGHMSKIFTGAADRGGVHINSGIPNRAFVLAAQELGGNAWDTAGRIWYDTLLQLSSNSQFQDCANLSVQVAAAIGNAEKKAVTKAWKTVGITV